MIWKWEGVETTIHRQLLKFIGITKTMEAYIQTRILKQTKDSFLGKPRRLCHDLAETDYMTEIVDSKDSNPHNTSDHNEDLSLTETEIRKESLPREEQLVKPNELESEKDIVTENETLKMLNKVLMELKDKKVNVNALDKGKNSTNNNLTAKTDSDELHSELNVDSDDALAEPDCIGLHEDGPNSVSPGYLNDNGIFL
ncbi:MAG: hypothetical protein MHPSP_004785, partial [Paramarteilia canceri]